jgi:hypothetical protein
MIAVQKGKDKRKAYPSLFAVSGVKFDCSAQAAILPLTRKLDQCNPGPEKFR